METIRHNLDLKCCNKTVIAPRRFVIDNKIRYVHILDGYCQYVQLYDHLIYHKTYLNNYKTFAEVARSNILKLHCNTKGLYFNYSYWVDNNTKKTIRVYLCD